MILGMSVAAFTRVHTIISLIGIAAGLAFLAGLLRGRFMTSWNLVFLIFTILTSVTGFFFHSVAIGPPHIVGAISLVDLAIALAALYAFRRAGAWRSVYAITATVALYFNCFVGVVQAFQKLAPLHALAPTQTEPPFLIAQALTLILFVAAGFIAIRRRA